MSALVESRSTLKGTELCVNPAVMVVPALNTPFLEYLVDSHCLCLAAHLYWLCPETWDLLQTNGSPPVVGLEAWQLYGW